MDREETPVKRPPAQKFARSLTDLAVVILTLSVLSPGVSIFVSSNPIIQQVGTGAVLAFALGGIVTYCQTAMIAELGGAYPTAGYDYAAIGHALGDWAAATTYFGGLFTIPIFLNLNAVGIALYLQPLIPGLHADTITYATVALVTAMAMLNIRMSEKITGLFLLVEVVALLLVAGLGVIHMKPAAAALLTHPLIVNGASLSRASASAIAMAAVAASWTLAGQSQAMYFSEDMAHPKRIGNIIVQTFWVTLVLEVAPIVGVVIGSHDLKAVLGSDAPFQAFLGQYLPATGMKLFSLSIAVAIFNACLAGFIGNGRNLFSMGRTNLFTPRLNHALTRLIPRTDAPWAALLLVAVTTALVTPLSLKAKLMLNAGNLTFMTLFYVWAVFAGRRSGRTIGSAFRVRPYPLLPLFGILIVVAEFIAQWMDEDTGRPSLFIWSGIFVLGYLYYRLMLMRRSEGWKLVGPADIDLQSEAMAVEGTSGGSLGI